MTTKSAGNFRTTYLLIGAVAVLLAGLAIYVWMSDDSKPNPQGILLESFHNIGTKSTDITGVEIEKAGAKLVFSRQPDGRWSLVQPIKARADSYLVESIVHQILTAKREEKNVDIVDNLGAHGLANPGVKVTLRRGDRTASVSLGNVSVGGDQSVVYVLTSDRPKQAQATLKKQLAALFNEKSSEATDAASALRDIDEFRTRKLLGEGMRIEEALTQITGIRLKVGDGKEVYVSRNNPDRAWRFVKPDGFGDVETNVPDQFNPETVPALAPLINNILSIEVASSKDFLPDLTDLTKIGLDPKDPNLLTVEIEREGSVGVEKLSISLQDEKGAAKGQLDKVYARYGDEEMVAQVNAAKPRLLRKFLEDPSSLRDRTLVKFRPDRVDAVDVFQNGKKAFELRKVDGKWKVYDGEKVFDANPDAVRKDLLDVLAQPNAVRGFPPPGSKDDALGFDKPIAEVHIWEDGIVKAVKEEPNARPAVRETPTSRILFGKKDVGDVVFVRRFLGTGKVDVKMPEQVLTQAARGRLDYVLAAPSGFKPEDVTRVVIPRGNDIYEIERGDDARWKIVAPESKKDKLANAQKVQFLLQSLASMQPQRIVAESPTLDQLKSMGLDPARPVQKVTLRLKGETADRVWSFGNVVGKSDSVYAKTSLSEFVIEVSKQFSEIAATGELVDPHLFQITASDVQGLKLKGWVDVTGVPLEFAFTRKPGGLWESAKKDLVIGGERMELFLANLLGLEAATIVGEKGKPVEHQGLDVNKGALEVTMEVASGKKIVLTLGNVLTKESKLIYALFNGDIITIKADQLLFDVKAKPAALNSR